jgi:cell division protein FtsQ
VIKNRISFLSVIFILALLVIISLFLIFSDTFNIKNIEIIGLNRLSKDHISNILELNGNDTNILMYNSSSMGDRLLKENAYIDKVEIKKVLPNSLIVSISERKLIAYIEFMQDYFLYIDDKCRVIEINNILKEPLPIIVGLNLEGFSLGKPLYEEDLPFLTL